MRLPPKSRVDAMQQMIHRLGRACATLKACHCPDHVSRVLCQCLEQTADAVNSTIPPPAGNLKSQPQSLLKRSLRSARLSACHRSLQLQKTKPQPPAKQSEGNKPGTCSTPGLS